MSDVQAWSQTLASPQWLPHRLDILGDRLLIAEVSEDICHQATFLEGETFVPRRLEQVDGLWALLDAYRTQDLSALGIFHVGHCGSTLLSRALQHAGAVSALREPAIMRMAASFQRDRCNPLALMTIQQCNQLTAVVFDWLSRRFHPTRPCLIKATSDCCNLVAPWLEHHADNKAMALMLRAEPFLVTMLRSDIRQQETRGFATSRLADLHRVLGDPSVRLAELSSGPMAAMSWASTAIQLLLAKQQHQTRILVVDFEQWLESPVSMTEASAGHLGVQAGSDTTEIIGRLLARYSKDPTMRYSRTDRDHELNHFRKEKAKEIDDGLRWLEALMRQYPVLSPLESWL